MPVNFVRASALLVLNSAKPWPISTQPPRRGGRRCLAHPLTVTVVACGCGLWNPSLWTEHLALTLARSLSLSLFAGPWPWPTAHRSTDAVAGRCSFIPPTLNLSLSPGVVVGGHGVGEAELPPPSWLAQKQGASAPPLILFFCNACSFN